MISCGELLARALTLAGLTEVFTLHGGHLDAFLVACTRSGIRLTDTRHEATAGHAADAWARLTGKPGVCVTTSGPGFTNTYTAIANAYLDAIPVLFIVGAPPLREVETNPLQGGFDQIAAAAPVTKWAHRATQPERIPELVALALRHATSGKPGPVLLEIPIDVMFTPVDEQDVRMPAMNIETPRTAPTTEQVTALVDVLMAAKRPIVVTGGGVVASDCAAEVRELAELLSVPVFTPNKGDGVIPASHPLHGGGASALGLLPRVAEAPDVVVLLGCRTGMFTGGRHGSLAEAKFVQVDVDAAEIGRLHDVSVSVTADCRETLRALNAALHRSDRPDNSVWAKSAAAAKDAHRSMYPDAVTDSGRIHPYHAAREVISALPERTVAVLDGGEAPAWAGMHFQAEEPHSVLRLGYLGCLGVGQGFAIGAHRADPHRPILLFVGDGSVAFNIAEFDTMVRFQMPIVTVVFNNAVWGMSIHGQQAVYGESGIAVSQLADSAYEQVAVAFGGHGERVDRLEDIGPAITRAFAAGVPACVNIAIDPYVVHPLTTSMLGDLTAEDEIVVPYYENIRVK